MPTKLKPREKKILFAQLVCEGLHKYEAALQLGYSKKSYKQQADKLMRDPFVEEQIGLLKGATMNMLRKDEIVKNVNALQEMGQIAPTVEQINTLNNVKINFTRLLQELYCISSFDPACLFDENGQPKKIQDLQPHERAAIAGVEATVKTSSNGDVTVHHTIKTYSKVPAISKLLEYIKLDDDKKTEKTEEELNEQAKQLLNDLAELNKKPDS